MLHLFVFGNIGRQASVFGTCGRPVNGRTPSRNWVIVNYQFLNAVDRTAFIIPKKGQDGTGQGASIAKTAKVLRI
jgi:hypothetical protein